MSLASAVQTVLAADTALIAIFGTLIKTYDDLGDLGLNRQAFPSAFDTVSGELLPIMIIKDRNANTTPAMTGEDEQLTSVLQACEIVVYQSRFLGYGALETGLQRVYAIIQDRNVSKYRMRERTRVTSERERLLSFACMCWSVYDAMWLNKP